MDKIALFLPDLGGGGAEKVMLNLAKGFGERGLSVDLVLAQSKGPYLNHVPAGVRLLDLSERGRFPTLPGLAVTAVHGLVRYLRRERPASILSTLTGTNLVALVARRLAGVQSRIVIREANTSLNIRVPGMRSLMRQIYRQADCLVAVSKGVADDLSKTFAIPADRIHVIPNPVDVEHLQLLALEAPSHPWLESEETPLILGVGRLAPQKDFETLLRAFAEVRHQRTARLMILGDGEKRAQLEALITALGLEEDVEMPGFVPNPYAYMKRATLFVLSSKWEGFPNVLAEAMAVGTSVVSTDCHSGPAEILEGGRYGNLAPVGNPTKLANAILDALDAPKNVNEVARASEFSVGKIVNEYLALLMPSRESSYAKS